MARRPKIHPYFLENAPSHWDIIAFLEQQLKEQGKSFDQNKAIGNWTASLKHLSQDEDPGRSSVAKDKSGRYYLNSRRATFGSSGSFWPSGVGLCLISVTTTQGQPSDRILAQNWLDRVNKGRRRKEQRRLAQTPPAPAGPKIRNTFNLSGGTNNVVGAGMMNNRSEGSTPPPSTTGHSRECLSENLGAASPSDTSPSSTSGDSPGGDQEATHLRETRLSCGHLYRNMVDKFALSDGRLLEDILYNHAVTLDKLSPAHFFIVDDKLLKKVLKKPEEKEVPRRVLREVRGGVLRIPPFPKNLHASMMRYQDSRTTSQCRAIARDSPDDEDVHWIDDVFRHIVELITNSGNILSYDFLNEGVWDSLVYPPLWDKYLASIPTIVLQRKEIQLVSLAPYSYLPGRPPHYDGVVQSRSLRNRRSDRRSDRYEFAIFEVSRSSDPKKLSADREKLVAGCRAMLSSLMELVEYDTEAIGRLVVVGVLQGGRGTRLLTMSCIGRNVFYLAEGSCWELPVEVKKLTAVNDVLRDVWKAKWAIMNTAATIDEFFAKKDIKEEEERRRRWEEEEEEEEEEEDQEDQEGEKGDGEGEDED